MALPRAPAEDDGSSKRGAGLNAGGPNSSNDSTSASPVSVANERAVGEWYKEEKDGGLAEVAETKAVFADELDSSSEDKVVDSTDSCTDDEGDSRPLSSTDAEFRSA